MRQQRIQFIHLDIWIPSLLQSPVRALRTALLQFFSKLSAIDESFPLVYTLEELYKITLNIQDSPIE
jgi:hypothetical protein